MRRRRPPPIPQRRPIFLGCEGESETGYGRLLGRLAQELGLHIHIHAEPLQPGAGDPLALVQKAIQRIGQLERQRATFAVKAVLLDIGSLQKINAATQLATNSGIVLVWQDPDHEALLLRHLPGCAALRPPAGASLAALRQRWDGYEKPFPAQRLAQRIGLVQVKQAASVENELRNFLISIGMLNEFD
jgi:hypothetical protein